MRLKKRDLDVEFIDAKAVNLPMLDRMYKEYKPGTAPAALKALAGKIKAADAFLFVVGEYNWGVQPGLKNLTDHSWKSGSGDRRPSPAIRPGGYPGLVQPRLGTGRFPRWE